MEMIVKITNGKINITKVFNNEITGNHSLYSSVKRTENNNSCKDVVQ